MSSNPDALATMPGPNGIEGLARATIAIGLLVAIGFGLSYVLVEHPFSDNKTIVTAILSALTTAFASVAAFYFGTRAMQTAQQAQQPNGSGGTSSVAEEGGALTVTITSPEDGAVYAVNQAVSADYSVAPSPGAEITFLSGTVENGAPLDTATLWRQGVHGHGEGLGRARSRVDAHVHGKRGPVGGEETALAYR